MSGSGDGLLYPWNAITDESIGNTLQGHSDSVSFVAVSSDGKRLYLVRRMGL